jgi:predicted secreted Zn-dependent protease
MDDTNRMNVKEALYETIQSQIDRNSPKETKAAYDRLVRAGRTHHDAMRSIAFVLVQEMNDMLRNNRPFNEARYIRALMALPGKLP